MSTAGTFTPRLIFLGFLVLLTAAPAAAGNPTLVGTWQATTTLDGGGGYVVPTLETYHADGTCVSSGPSAFSGNGHGVWKAHGPGFSVSLIIFGYDPGSGELAYTVNATTELEVSSDGRSMIGALRAEVIALDGTVLAVNTGTITARRLAQIVAGGSDEGG